MDVFKIATLNNNGLASRTKVKISEDILLRQEIDFLCLQEVATLQSTTCAVIAPKPMWGRQGGVPPW